MSRLVAIDFETANEQRASPCAIGLSYIEDGRVSETEAFLIRPPEMRFSRFNIAVHGITPEDVRDAPEWPELLEGLAPKLEGATLIAHNSIETRGASSATASIWVKRTGFVGDS